MTTDFLTISTIPFFLLKIKFKKPNTVYVLNQRTYYGTNPYLQTPEATQGTTYKPNITETMCSSYGTNLKYNMHETLHLWLCKMQCSESIKRMYDLNRS
jgi:hypothetical protein